MFHLCTGAATAVLIAVLPIRGFIVKVAEVIVKSVSGPHSSSQSQAIAVFSPKYGLEYGIIGTPPLRQYPS